MGTNDLHSTPDANRDGITGEPGAHPVGTGVGATSGAIAGAAAGALAGPVGAAIGLVAGAVAGGYGGKVVAEGVNPTVEDAYWRDSYQRESYVQPGRTYDDYRPAYELGWSSPERYDSFDAAEPTLAREWDSRRGTSSLAWDDAKHAARAAWTRVGEAVDGDGARGDMLDNDDVIDVLNDLKEISRDGEYGFKTSAEQVESSQMKALFMERGQQCGQAAEELIQHIVRLGGSVDDGGTVAGAMHRGWVSVKGSVGANSELSILEEVERGEDAAVAQYRKALKNNLPSDVRALVQRQADGAQRNHDKIRDLRNAARDRH